MPTDPDTPRDLTSSPQPRPDYPDYDAPNEPRRNPRATIVAVVLTVVLVGAGLWLAHLLADMRKVQDCVLSGRTNCAPLDTR